MTGFLGWTWSGCSFSFPDRLISEIKATPISFYARNTDRITWSSSPSGVFELKEAYKLASLDEEGHFIGCFDGDWIWKASTRGGGKGGRGGAGAPLELSIFFTD